MFEELLPFIDTARRVRWRRRDRRTIDTLGYAMRSGRVFFFFRFSLLLTLWCQRARECCAAKICILMTGVLCRHGPFRCFVGLFFGVYRRLRGLTIWVRRIACRVYLIACCVECVCVCMYVCVWRGE